MTRSFMGHDYSGRLRDQHVTYTAESLYRKHIEYAKLCRVSEPGFCRLACTVTWPVNPQESCDVSDEEIRFEVQKAGAGAGRGLVVDCPCGLFSASRSVG